MGFVAAAAQLHYAFAALGRAVGALAPSDSVANAVASLLLLCNLLLSGFFVSPDDLPAFWGGLAKLMPAGAAYEALVIHEFAGVDDLFISSKVGSATAKTGPYSGETILRCFGFDAHDWFSDHANLLLFAVGFDALTCLVFVVWAFESR